MGERWVRMVSWTRRHDDTDDRAVGTCRAGAAHVHVHPRVNMHMRSCSHARTRTHARTHARTHLGAVIGCSGD